MSLQQKIEHSIDLRKSIRALEQELFELCLDIEKDTLAECEANTNIKAGSYITDTRTDKKYIADSLQVFFDQNGLPFINPVLRRVRSDGVTPGNILDVDNFLHSISITDKWHNFAKEKCLNAGREFQYFHKSHISHILMMRCNNLNNYALFFPKEKRKKN